MDSNNSHRAELNDKRQIKYLARAWQALTVCERFLFINLLMHLFYAQRMNLMLMELLKRKSLDLHAVRCTNFFLSIFFLGFFAFPPLLYKYILSFLSLFMVYTFGLCVPLRSTWNSSVQNEVRRSFFFQINNFPKAMY